MAIVDDGEATVHGYGTGTTTSPARLCAQFAYDPYGVLLAVQELHPFPDPRTGHKGLHLDRLDAGVADPVSGAPIARHTVGATHAYFVRNRHYSPDLGRFMQRDPNATGALLASLSPSAGVPGIASVALAALLSDGAALYQYCRSEPTRVSDPSGLWFGYAAQMATMAIDAYLDASGRLEDARTNLRYGMNFVTLLDNVITDAVMDAEWAGDWDQADESYSKSATFDVEAAYGINTNFDMDRPTFLDMGYGTGNPIGRKSVSSRKRKHGDPLHDQKIREKANEYIGMSRAAKREGRNADIMDFRTMRKNQVFTDPQGRRICNRRPDLVVWNRDGTKVWINESTVTQTKSAAQRLLREYDAIGKRLGFTVVGTIN